MESIQSHSDPGTNAAKNSAEGADSALNALEESTLSEKEKLERTLASLTRVSSKTDATNFALRYGVARYPDTGIFGGVCEALANSYGLPVRLVRTWALTLSLLGPGPLIYLILYLVIPRPAKNQKALAKYIDDRYPELPKNIRHQGYLYNNTLQAIVSKQAEGGDWLAVLLLIPAAAVALGITFINVIVYPLGLAFLVPVNVLLGLVIVLGGWRATRTRTTYLFTKLAQEAGIIDQSQMLFTIDKLRREAPKAWGSKAGGEKADSLGRVNSSNQVLPLKAVLVVLSISLLLGTTLYAVSTSFPAAFPNLNQLSPNPLISKLGALSAIFSATIGVCLIVVGAKGYTSKRLVAIAMLGLIFFAGSVWLARVTDSRTVEPHFIVVDEYMPGAYYSCPSEGVQKWNQAVVIDLQQMKPQPSADEAIAIWNQKQEIFYEEYIDLNLYISCYRSVGDIYVILPEENWDINTDLRSEFGLNINAERQKSVIRDVTRVGISIDGETLIGKVGLFTKSEWDEYNAK